MEITPVYQRVIGLDIHHEQVTACALVDEGVGEAKVYFNTFATFHNDCLALAAWAKTFSPDIVVMESTGVYWKSVNRALRQAGIKTVVGNAWHLKQVPGRKTDIADSQWLAMLGRAGLIRPSFVPEPHMEQLRIIARHRQQLSRMLASEKNRLHKILSDAGIRLSVVVSDLQGVAAKKMIECLVWGGSPDEALRFATTNLKAPRASIRKALEGDLSRSHIFTLQRVLKHIKYLEEEMALQEAELIGGLEGEEWALRLLETIPGIDRVGAAMLLVEIGVDMSVFGSAAKLASWAGVCPGNNESAGKKRSGKTRKANHWVRRLLCEMAHAAKKTKSMFKAKYQSLAIRRGAKRSVFAVAHKMLRVIFTMLTRKQAYKDKTINYEELVVKRNGPRWLQQLQKYGFLEQFRRQNA